MRSPQRAQVVAVIALAALAGATLSCSKSKGGAPGAAHVSGTPHTDKVVDTFTDAGLHAEGFAPVQPIPFGAAYCEQGRVEGIDTLVCEFADDASVDQGKKLMQDQWEREGVQTGVASTAKRTLIGIVDRGHHDPNGKTISRIVTAFKRI